MLSALSITTEFGQIRPKLRSDVIVVQDELLMCERAIYRLADAHRANAAAATVLLRKEPSDKEGGVKTNHAKTGVETDAVVLAVSETNSAASSVRRLLMLQADLEADENIRISGTLMAKNSLHHVISEEETPCP